MRYGNQWLFVSFAGKVHPVDVSGPEVALRRAVVAVQRRRARRVVAHRRHAAPRRAPAQRAALRAHASRRRATRTRSRARRCGSTTSRRSRRAGARRAAQPGRDDLRLSDRRRPRLGVAVQPPLGLGARQPSRRPAVGFIQVTQDDAPLLVTASQFFGSLGVYDAPERRASCAACSRPGGRATCCSRRGADRDAMSVLAVDPAAAADRARARCRCCSAGRPSHKLRDVARFRARARGLRSAAAAVDRAGRRAR